ncbi:unnamed protein product [Victoria cruziana]
MNWKMVGSIIVPESQQQEQVVLHRKKLSRKVRQVPDYYFLPHQLIPTTIALYGAICATGIGAGMLVEVWINNKIKAFFSKDGGIVWEMVKK